MVGDSKVDEQKEQAEAYSRDKSGVQAAFRESQRHDQVSNRKTTGTDNRNEGT